MGRLELAGRTIETPVKCLLSFSTSMPDKGLPGVAVDAFFTLRGKDLGLGPLADEEIDVRIGMRGTLEKAGGPAGKAQ
jgi:hypothetical protein